MDILIIDDEKSIREMTSMAVEDEGHYAETADSEETGLLTVKEGKFELIFLDLRLGDSDGLAVLKKILEINPSQLVVVFTAHSSVDVAVKAMRSGAFDFLQKPFTPEQLRGLLLRAEKASKLSKKVVTLENEVTTLKTEVSNSSVPLTFETADPAMSKTLDVLFRAAATPASILILGESGTGKSVVTKAVHERSHLASKPFVTVSCPSLSKELLESELFGHIRGSFTGAVKDKWGKVHAADGGTLFLDEIGELPLDIQPKLLRLLQEREYERLGETKTRTANVRVIAATNRDLKQAVEEGTFREDLYYRLNVITVEMPSLRHRPQDLIDIANKYATFFAKQTGRKVTGFSKDGLAALTAYDWPGNLRELRNSIERAVILTHGNEITASDLPSASLGGQSIEATDAVVLGADATLEQLEEEHIRRVLSRATSIQEAADMLGIDKATLYRKRKKMGLA